MINKDLISVRDLSESDIPLILDYWFHSAPGFIESIGVDPSKLPPESDFKLRLQKKCQESQNNPAFKMDALVITYNGEPVGFHSINEMKENDSGIFHAHLIRPEMRRLGVGSVSYLLASLIFIERFNLRRILFKTPVQNIGAIRVKQRLGIREVGEETIGFGIVKQGTLAKVFELTKEEAIELSKTQSSLAKNLKSNLTGLAQR